MWNTQTGLLLKTVTAAAPDNVFSAIAISQDGTKIASIKTTQPTGALQLTVQAVEDGRVLLTQSLNPPKNQILKTNYLIKPGVLHVVFSPDGKQVITQVSLESQNYQDGTLYNRLDFRDITTGKITQSVNLMSPNDSERVGSPFSPNANGPTTVNIWQRNKNNRFDYLTALSVSKDKWLVDTIAFTNSNLLNLTTVKDYETRLDTWNPQTGEQVQSTTLPSEECLQQGDVLSSPDGTSSFSSYVNVGACLGNIQTEEFQRNLDGLSSNLERSVFSGDGDSIAVAGDREIRIFK